MAASSASCRVVRVTGQSRYIQLDCSNGTIALLVLWISLVSLCLVQRRLYPVLCTSFVDFVNLSFDGEC